MNISQIYSVQELATDIVVSIVNAAKEKLGNSQTLEELANSRDFAENTLVSLKKLVDPISLTSEQCIRDAIEKHWQLTSTFKYALFYLGGSKDEISQYYYYEAIFSQPTAKYPIPQATVSVFFRLEDKQIEVLALRRAPKLTFHLEGQHSEYDIRHVRLTPDWILGILQMKLKLFKQIESYVKF